MTALLDEVPHLFFAAVERARHQNSNRRRAHNVHVDPLVLERRWNVISEGRNLMRSLKMLLCSCAVAATFVASGTGAQEWSKTTYFTFDQPVQLPGMVLPAGEYMFRLADPESGRRVIGVWEKDGSKFHGMLQTRVESRARDPQNPAELKDSVIMFRESPSGEPQAVRTYVFAGERMGYEFIYPREQASKIAKASQTAVLATDGGGFGQVDQTGTFASTADAPDATTPASTATATTATAPAAAATATATTTTAPQPEPAPAATATATTAPRPEPAPAAAAAPEPEPVPVTARAAQNEPRPVGTAGQNTLPQTAGALPVLQLIGGLSLLSGVAVRRFRMASTARCSK
jgi:hypothetical protein